MDDLELCLYDLESFRTILCIKSCKTTFYAHLSRIWKLMRFIRKVFATKILLSRKFCLFLTLNRMPWWKQVLQKHSHKYATSWTAVQCLLCKVLLVCLINKLWTSWLYHFASFIKFGFISMPREFFRLFLVIWQWGLLSSMPGKGEISKNNFIWKHKWLFLHSVYF